MATKSRKYTDLVQQAMEEPVTDLQTTEATESVKPELTELQEEGTSVAATVQASNTDLQSPKVTESETIGLPKYQTLDRKETRLRADQIEALTLITKGLNRKRRGQGERLTDNTLIRVAVDLLLSRSNELHGVTEADLRQSLGLTE